MSAVAGRRAESRRLLLIAYRLDPDFSMESRLAWRRALSAARDYRVTVLCALSSLTKEQAGAGHIDPLVVPPSRLELALARTPGGASAAYGRWQRRASRAAQREHAREPFDLAHHVSYCGYRQPSPCWRLGVPYIWGPIGGTHAFPRQFLSAIDRIGAAREVARNAVNALELRWSRRVSAAIRASTTVLAASDQVKRELTAAGRRVDGVMLETGVDADARCPRAVRDPAQPLRLLWAGRACSWKALPLLLHALADVSPSCDYRLRVMSAGPQLTRWQRLAAKLGLNHKIEWVGWPGCFQREPHYRWADALAFTSLRDTSGTGLLEALAAGAPIIGLNHQGAADVMTQRCAIRVPVTSPDAAVAGFRTAVERLAADPELLARLSAGAMERAAEFDWMIQGRRLADVYAAALAGEAEAAAQPARPAQTLSLAGGSASSQTSGACRLRASQSP